MDLLSEWRGKQVLITGGTGFIGRHVIDLALREGVVVHNISLHPDAPPGVQQHQANLCDREQVFDIIARLKPQGIIHLAAAGVSYGSSSLGQLLQGNTIATENLLAAADASGAQPIVVIAGSGFEHAAQDHPISESDPLIPFSDYGVSKSAAALCASRYAHRMTVLLLRLFSVYGPGEKDPRLVPHIISSAKTGLPVELTSCEQIRDYTYVEDLAEAFWRAICLPRQEGTFRVFNVGTGNTITLKKLVMQLSELLRKRGLETKILFGAKPYRPDEPFVYAPDVTLMKKVFDWLPPTNLIEGLHRTLASEL